MDAAQFAVALIAFSAGVLVWLVAYALLRKRRKN
jgi:hypothetical protein